jgi:hypothetical protein
MKIASKILEAKINYNAIADQLVNNEEVSPDDLTEYGLNQTKAKNIIDAWFKLSPPDRDKMGFNTSNLIKWIKSIK